MRRALAAAEKEVRQILRDPLTLGILLGIPTFMLLLYGFALNFDVRHVRTAVVDYDRSAESRDWVSDLEATTYFDVVATPSSDPALGQLLQTGRVRAGIVLPAGFAERVRSGREVDVMVLLDGSDANTATTVLNYFDAFAADRNARIRAQALFAAGIDPAGIELQPRVWYNPSLRSTYFLLPGLIGFILMLTGVIATALSVVREKERGTLAQLRVTPIATSELLIGKCLPFLAISLVAMTIVLIAARVLFGLRIQGSVFQLYLVSMLYIVGALGFGLLISTLVNRQQEAFQLAALSSMLPTLLLSGFIFPIRSMPVALQALTHIVPARYYLVLLRGVILKGTSVLTYPTELAALGIYVSIVLALASLRLARQEG